MSSISAKFIKVICIGWEEGGAKEAGAAAAAVIYSARHHSAHHFPPSLSADLHLSAGGHNS